MRYALFTSPESFVDEVDLIEKIFNCGVDFLYVQKPLMNNRALERFLLSLPERVRAKTFLYGFPSTAQEFGLLGFHQPIKWFLENEAAALRAPGLLSVEVESTMDLLKLSAELRTKISQVVLKNAAAESAGTAFVVCDATELPAGISNVAITSGIWEFADPVSAWRRLCK